MCKRKICAADTCSRFQNRFCAPAVHEASETVGGHDAGVWEGTGQWSRGGVGEVLISALILLRHEVSNLHSPISPFLICKMERDRSFCLLSLL